MKENWASPYLEAHLNMQDDTDSVNNDCSIDDGINVYLNRQFFLNNDCVRIQEQQQIKQQQRKQQKLQSSRRKQHHHIVAHRKMSTMPILIMFQNIIFYILIVYLLFTTNAVVFANAIDSTEIGDSAGNGNELFRLIALASDASSAIDFGE